MTVLGGFCLVRVEKYGGTSIDGPEKIQKITGHLKALQDNNEKAIVIVSAFAKRTDELLSRARSIDSTVSGRELDLLLSTGETESASLLAIALAKNNVKAISLCAFQIPIIASGEYQQARILKIFKDRIAEYLDQNTVVIIPGFQGMTKEGNSHLGQGRIGYDCDCLAKSLMLLAIYIPMWKEYILWTPKTIPMRH